MGRRVQTGESKHGTDREGKEAIDLERVSKR